MFTPLPITLQDTELPQRLNCPFYYQPHPLCMTAVEEAKKEIMSMAEWEEEIHQGKMFGILIVRDSDLNVGYLKAYSGQIGGRQDWRGWVPAIFDYLQPDGYFKQHEAEITHINHEIIRLLSSDVHRINCARLAKAEKEAEEQIKDYKERMAQCKQRRDIRRQEGEPEETLMRESQYMKAELRRLKHRLDEGLSGLRSTVSQHENNIILLRAKRKRLSDNLQAWLFDQFTMLNGKGEKKTLTEIFADTPAGIPPSGAGECCAPKLLQYAYSHSLQLIAIAEFWWGESPVGEIRRHLDFYPACQGKCRPILDYMLQGIDIEPNPLEEEETVNTLRTIYEDDWLVAVDKPAGMLSVPGKGKRLSAQEILARQYGNDSAIYCVHRLDMQTSGLLLFAKDESVQRAMQRAFALREVKKTYRAVLEGIYEGDHHGTISLPLSADYYNRPRQRVDYEGGKSAETHYEIIGSADGHSIVRLSPLTGRTHQLRIHCAHTDGLGIPIAGDDLYGHHADRLMLHAEEIVFTHPATEETIRIISKAPF